MALLLVFILGAFIGSFLGVVVYRLPKRESIVFPPSHCPHCRHKLAFYDLIPIISYILLLGKCRYCKQHISYFDFFIEVVTAMVFALTFYFFGNLGIVLLCFYLLMVSVFIVIFFTDLRYGIIPFQVVLIGIIASFLYLVFPLSPFVLLVHLVSAFGAFLSFLFLFLITKGRGMGFGDVILVMLMGLFLGFPGIAFALYIAFLTGAAASLILILMGSKHLRHDTIPFGPFLVFGTLISQYFGSSIQIIVRSFLPI